MRLRLALSLAALCLATAAEAKRRVATPVNTPTGIRCADGRIAAWDRGFAVNDAAAPGGKSEIRAFTPDGKSPKTLVSSAAPISEWCASPKSTFVAWISSGRVHVTTAADGSDRDLGEADRGLAVSPDEKTLAFLRGGSLVLRDVQGDRARVVAPRERRTLAAPAVFSGDGSAVIVGTLPEGKEREPGGPDEIEKASLAADSPAFESVYTANSAGIRSLVAARSGPLIAFVEVGVKSSTLRVFDLAAGKLHEYSSEGDYRTATFDAKGTHLLVVSGDGRNLQVRIQQLFRSGTMRTYWSDPLSVPGSGDAVSPVEGFSTSWFLRPAAEGKGYEVVEAHIE